MAREGRKVDKAAQCDVGPDVKGQNDAATLNLGTGIDDLLPGHAIQVDQMQNVALGRVEIRDQNVVLGVGVEGKDIIPAAVTPL